MKNISITPSQLYEQPFRNHARFCVGTGRMGLALTKEYLDELRFVQDNIGFRYIRGHGLFCDDMAIYHEYEENGETKVEYNYTYLDRVMDAYRKVNLAPFLELGFMPEQMASGSQTVFYWKGNTTPPADYDKWADMVTALFLHLFDRYGREEVITWPVEVWNEPNLPGFWENADMEEYFRLFEITFRAVKRADDRIRVGGPAVCGVRDEFWIRSFLEFCRKEGLHPDFVTRHHYTTGNPEPDGHYAYQELRPHDEGFANLKTSREAIDDFPEFAGMDIYITEFSTSYIPNNPLHDSNENAAYEAGQLSRLGEVNESYSYWTFGDVFEEKGVPFSEFHGGFGLVAAGCVPKPTFWTFKFYSDLERYDGTCLIRDRNLVLEKKTDGSYMGIAWNWGKETGDDILIDLTLPAGTGREYAILTETVDPAVTNPVKTWHDLGEPRTPDEAQLALIKESAGPRLSTQRTSCEGGEVSLQVPVAKDGVVRFRLLPIRDEHDRGYRITM